MPSPRIAASSYLNTSPLCYSFVRGKQRDLCEFLSDASPALCAEMLARGEADAAMIPVIEYQRISGIKISPHTCVSSRSRVRSVVLVSKVPVRQIQSVALDTTSRTSAVLVRILLAKFYGLSPEYRPAAPRLPEMLNSSDAALVIGDPAMLIDRSGLEVYDLSEEWLKHTGLPFVFAFWAIRTESEGLFHAAGGSIDFVAALAEGMASIDAIPMDDDLLRGAGFVGERCSVPSVEESRVRLIGLDYGKRARFDATGDWDCGLAGEDGGRYFGEVCDAVGRECGFVGRWTIEGCAGSPGAPKKHGTRARRDFAGSSTPCLTRSSRSMAKDGLSLPAFEWSVCSATRGTSCSASQ